MVFGDPLFLIFILSTVKKSIVFFFTNLGIRIGSVDISIDKFVNIFSGFC